MKNQEMKGYTSAKPKVEANNEAIHKLIGVKSPSYGNIVAQPKKESTTKADQSKKEDIHVNDTPYDMHEAGKKSRLDIRMEEAYSFLSGVSTDDNYSESDATESTEEVESTEETTEVAEDTNHSEVETEVETKVQAESHIRSILGL